mmetsp:Transcript_100945/g.283629  ORF Transcript_100945/g.283629 Transcript_100945/m.283629 type:complete len:181 (-) Transcript_100945:432-974(-)
MSSEKGEAARESDVRTDNGVGGRPASDTTAAPGCRRARAPGVVSTCSKLSLKDGEPDRELCLRTMRRPWGEHIVTSQGVGEVADVGDFGGVGCQAKLPYGDGVLNAAGRRPKEAASGELGRDLPAEELATGEVGLEACKRSRKVGDAARLPPWRPPRPEATLRGEIGLPPTSKSEKPEVE